MNSGRQLPQSDYLRLKAATRELVETVGGNVQAAKITRVAGSLISRYGSPQDTMQMPIDVIADLEGECGEPIVTRVLAEMNGFVLVPRASIERPNGAIDAAPPKITRGIGEVLIKTGEAMRDGIITEAEAADIEPVAREVLADVTEFAGALKARATRKVR